MSRQAPPVLFRYQSDTGPSLTVVLAVFVALFVLFLWLHFIVAQQIESVGREIQVKTEELHRIERQIQDLQRQIAIAGSQKRLALRAQSLGYQPQKPVYLRVHGPLPPDTTSIEGPVGRMSSMLFGFTSELTQTSSTWDALTSEMNAGSTVPDAP